MVGNDALSVMPLFHEMYSVLGDLNVPMTHLH
jgi:hypothetical protein